MLDSDVRGAVESVRTLQEQCEPAHEGREAFEARWREVTASTEILDYELSETVRRTRRLAATFLARVGPSGYAQVVGTS